MWLGHSVPCSATWLLCPLSCGCPQNVASSFTLFLFCFCALLFLFLFFSPVFVVFCFYYVSPSVLFPLCFCFFWLCFVLFLFPFCCISVLYVFLFWSSFYFVSVSLLFCFSFRSVLYLFLFCFSFDFLSILFYFVFLSVCCRSVSALFLSVSVSSLWKPPHILTSIQRGYLNTLK